MLALDAAAMVTCAEYEAPVAIVRKILDSCMDNRPNTYLGEQE